MTQPQITPDLIAKLPKWAQAHIAEIQGQRDTAVDALKRYVDNQTPSRIFVTDLVCTKKGGPDFNKIYIQAPREEVTFDLDETPSIRENQVTIRIDRENRTQLLISASWNQISMFPLASNMIALKGSRP